LRTTSSRYMIGVALTSQFGCKAAAAWKDLAGEVRGKLETGGIFQASEDFTEEVEGEICKVQLTERSSGRTSEINAEGV